jgi:hypothetical protein
MIIYLYRTLAQAFIALATQTSKESEGHSLIAGVLANDISIPIKNLAESQYKDRKSVNENLFSCLFYLKF